MERVATTRPETVEITRKAESEMDSIPSYTAKTILHKDALKVR